MTLHNIAAIVLAAGQSTRMVRGNKLLMDFGGEKMVRRCVGEVHKSKVSQTSVITGFESDKVASTLSDMAIDILVNPDFDSGLSSSLKCGVSALSSDVDGAIICLADMPLVEVAHLDRIIEAFDPSRDRLICVPYHGGQRGNPILWSKKFFAEIMELDGDEGARRLLTKHQNSIYPVDFESNAVLYDVDEESTAQHD